MDNAHNVRSLTYYYIRFIDFLIQGRFYFNKQIIDLTFLSIMSEKARSCYLRNISKCIIA